MKLDELMDGGGHCFEQAFGLNIDLVHNPFDVAILTWQNATGKE